MKTSVMRFLRDEEGATAIEYGIIAGLMAVVLVAAFSSNSGIGKALSDTFSYIESQLPKAPSP
jgi:pilus assembly protein Flp/PilA